jgi:hypothetical protein
MYDRVLFLVLFISPLVFAGWLDSYLARRDEEKMEREKYWDDLP